MRYKCTRWKSNAVQYFFFFLSQKISNSKEKSARSKQICDFKGKRICGVICGVQDEDQTQHNIFSSPLFLPSPKNIRFHGKIGKIETDLRFQEKENMRCKWWRYKMKIKHSTVFFLLPFPKNIQFHGKIRKIETDLRFQKKKNMRHKCTRWKSNAAQYFFFLFPKNVQDENQIQHNILSSFFPKKYPKKNRQDRNRFSISRETEYAA